MTFQALVLPSDELIIRLFARHPSALAKQVKVRPQDFDRPIDRMSGISMFREKAKNRARANWNSEWSRGILIAKAGEVQALGLTFYDTGNDHFSVRCSGCDLSQNQGFQKPLCQNPHKICDFDPSSASSAQVLATSPIGIRNRLMQIFDIDTIPY